MKRQIQTSICLSVCLSIYLSIYLHQSIPLSLSAYESIHIFICLSIHPSTYSFIYSYNYISISEKNGERIFIFVHLLHITFIYMRYIHSFFYSHLSPFIIFTYITQNNVLETGIFRHIDIIKNSFTSVRKPCSNRSPFNVKLL